MHTFAPICSRFRAFLLSVRVAGIRDQGSGVRDQIPGRADFINATLGCPVLAEKTGIHVKTLHQMFGQKGNPTAANLFNIIACLQEQEGVRLRVVAYANSSQKARMMTRPATACLCEERRVL